MYSLYISTISMKAQRVYLLCIGCAYKAKEVVEVVCSRKDMVCFERNPCLKLNVCWGGD